MLTAVPKSWFSGDYEVFDDGELVATLDLSWFREKGTLVVRDATYAIGREGWMSGKFFLEENDAPVISAVKTSAFRRAFDVEMGSLRYRFEATSIFTRAFRLRDGQRTIGAVRPASVFGRKALIELPEDMPLAARIFLAWLAIILWRRQRRNND